MDSKNVLLRMQNIVSNLENAQLEDVDKLLNYFNGESVMIEGVSTRPFNDPKIAAMLNARYTELTGEDHPNFLAQQPKVLDDLLSRESFYLRNDAYTPMQMDMFRRLRENVDRSGPGVEIIVNGKNHVLTRMDSIMQNLGEARLEDVEQLLKYFNGESVIKEGVPTSPFNDPKTAAMLNARYTELTGENHPNFLTQQPKVLDDILSQERVYLKNDAYTPTQMDMFRRLKENIDGKGPGVEIVVNGENHVLTRMDSIMQNLGEATLEDVDQLLNYFNGKSVLMDGTYTRPFNNPDMAARLNARYSEFTGQNHSNYMVQQPKVLANILKNEKLFIENGAYTKSQIHSYRLMKQNIDNSPERKEAVFSSMKNLGTRFGITASKIIERRKSFDENCYKRYSTTRYTTSKCDTI